MLKVDLKQLTKSIGESQIIKVAEEKIHDIAIIGEQKILRDIAQKLRVECIR